MKKYILFLITLFINVLSYAQHYYLKELFTLWCSAPSYVVVKVKSPSYEGDAIITANDFSNYYRTTKKRHLKSKKRANMAYRDVKRGKCFIVSDEDFEIKYGQPQPYYFEKIIVNDTVLDIAKKGIELFIRTYFDDKGAIISPPSQREPYNFNTIVKVMFDAGIQTGIDSEWSYYYIQDPRFYKEGKFVIPPEYRDSKE
jgi:hypothetical protein